MDSLTRKDLEEFIGIVTKARDAAYENALEHSGAIKAAEHFIWKLSQAESVQPKEDQEGAPSPEPPTAPTEGA